MTTCLGKTCSFCLLCMSFVNIYDFFFVSSPFGLKGGMWDSLVLIINP